MKTIKFVAFMAVIAIASVATARHVHAGNSSATVQVTATVAKSCVISNGALSFGSYDPVVANASAALTVAGNFTVTCTKGTVYNVALGNGNNNLSGARRMTNASDFLTYEIYSDAARTKVWSQGSAGVSGVSLGATPVTITMYGSIPGGQNVEAGSYADTVVSTVNF